MRHRSIRDYLFCEGDLGDALRTQAANAQKHVDAIPESRFATASDADILREVEAEFRADPADQARLQAATTLAFPEAANTLHPSGLSFCFKFALASDPVLGLEFGAIATV